MEKILFCNLDLLKIAFDGNANPALQKIRNQFLSYAKELCSDEENHIYFISRDQKLILPKNILSVNMTVQILNSDCVKKPVILSCSIAIIIIYLYL